jgi:hypothetical protein
VINREGRPNNKYFPWSEKRAVDATRNLDVSGCHEILACEQQQSSTLAFRVDVS